MAYKDHLNNTYKTFGDMCLKYGIGRSTVTARLKRGWSLEKALTTPLKKQASNAKKVKDCLGNSFDSISDMCRAYLIDKDTYHKRIKRGYTVEEALTTPEDKNK